MGYAPQIPGLDNRGSLASTSLRATSDFLTEVTNAGGTYTTAQEAAVLALVSAIKTAGLWPKFGAFYPFVGGVASSHALNLIDPTRHRIKWSGTLTHSANGVTGDGSTGYGSTRFFPLRHSSWTKISGTIGVYVYAAGTAGAPDLRSYIGGVSAFSSELTMYGHLASGGQGFYASVNQTSQSLYAVVGNSKKLLCVSRVDATNEKLYYDDGTATLQSSTSSPTIANAIDVPLFLLARCGDVNGGTIDRYNNATISAAFVGEGVSGTEAAALKTALDAFQSAMSRATP